MDKSKVINLVKAYKQLILKDFPAAKVYLYGSYSKGSATEKSDIDVAIVVPKVEDNWLDKSTKLWYATLSVSTLIEPVLIDEQHPSPLYGDILKTGISV